jgi:hypothetical protein
MLTTHRAGPLSGETSLTRCIPVEQKQLYETSPQNSVSNLHARQGCVYTCEYRRAYVGALVEIESVDHVLSDGTPGTPRQLIPRLVPPPPPWPSNVYKTLDKILM